MFFFEVLTGSAASDSEISDAEICLTENACDSNGNAGVVKSVMHHMLSYLFNQSQLIS